MCLTKYKQIKKKMEGRGTISDELDLIFLFFSQSGDTTFEL